MKAFLDTSVLVAAMIQEHASHSSAFAVLERVLNGIDEGFLSGHSLAEVYSVLTRAPVPFRHSPEQALLSIEENIIKHFKVTCLAANDYAALIREAALCGVRGGTIYDAVLLKCAAKATVDKIFTLNVKHFQAVASKELSLRIIAP